MSYVVTKTVDGVIYRATVGWDSGDPSAGIPPGWSEDTGVEIIAGRFVTYLQWRDITGTLTDPAEFHVESVELTYHWKDQGKHYITLAYTPHSAPGLHSSMLWTQEEVGSVLRLSALPEVLEVVQGALEDFKAAERLQALQEQLWMMEGEPERIRFAADERGRGLTAKEQADIRQLETAIDQLRRDLAEALTIAQQRGVA